MTDAKNSSRWKKEKKVVRKAQSRILKERAAEPDRVKWDEMCRAKATSGYREEEIYWYFRHVKVPGENKLEQDTDWKKYDQD